MAYANTSVSELGSDIGSLLTMASSKIIALLSDKECIFIHHLFKGVPPEEMVNKTILTKRQMSPIIKSLETRLNITTTFATTRYISAYRLAHMVNVLSQDPRYPFTLKISRQTFAKKIIEFRLRSASSPEIKEAMALYLKGERPKDIEDHLGKQKSWLRFSVLRILKDTPEIIFLPREDYAKSPRIFRRFIGNLKRIGWVEEVQMAPFNSWLIKLTSYQRTMLELISRGATYETLQHIYNRGDHKFAKKLVSELYKALDVPTEEYNYFPNPATIVLVGKAQEKGILSHNINLEALKRKVMQQQLGPKSSEILRRLQLGVALSDISRRLGLSKDKELKLLRHIQHSLKAHSRKPTNLVKVAVVKGYLPLQSKTMDECDRYDNLWYRYNSLREKSESQTLSDERIEVQVQRLLDMLPSALSKDDPLWGSLIRQIISL